MAAMVTQAAWTRVIGLSIGNSTYAIALVVSLFILGLSLGGYWATQRVSGTDSVSSLSRVYLFAGLLSLFTVLILGYGPLIFFVLLSLGSQYSWSWLLFFESIGIGLLIIPPTFLMGAVIPFTLDVVAKAHLSDPAARNVGSVYSVNTVGAILGTLLGGLVLVPVIGSEASLKLAALMYIALGLSILLLIKPVWRNSIPSVVTIVLFFLILAVMPRWDPLLMNGGFYLLRNQEAIEAAREFKLRDVAAISRGNLQLLYHSEGVNGTVAITRSGDNIALRVSGKPDASNQADMSTQVCLSMIPILAHRDPKEVLVIGLGSGISAGAARSDKRVERVDVVELLEEVVEASAYFSNLNRLSYVDSPPYITSPGVELLINDARNHLLLSSRSYDVIASEPSNPWMSGVANLFTREAFALARSRLKPGGIMAQWIHSYDLEEEHFLSVLATFGEVFRTVQLWEVARGDYLVLGSDGPIRFNTADLATRIEEPGIKEFLKLVQLDRSSSFVSNFLAEDMALRNRSRNAKHNTDDNMLLEFSAPTSIYFSQKSFEAFNVIPILDDILDKGSMADQARLKFTEEADLSLQAREHQRLASAGFGSKEAHNSIINRLDPYILASSGPVSEDSGNVRATEYERELLSRAQTALSRGDLKTARQEISLVSSQVRDPVYFELLSEILTRQKRFYEAMLSYRLRWAGTVDNREMFLDFITSIDRAIESLPEQSEMRRPLYIYLRRNAQAFNALYPEDGTGREYLNRSYMALESPASGN
jgi:spermidine synthase